MNRKLLSVLQKYGARRYLKIWTSQNNKKLEAVALSYASYQNSKSYSGDIPSPVIVMHGLFGSKSNWNSLCKAMHQKTDPQRAIYAVDARNHGESPHTAEHSYQHLALDVRQFLNEHRIKKTSLLGHSMGGRAMMMFALKYPELVEKLVVIDISPFSVGTSYQQTSDICHALQSFRFDKDVSLSTARTIADKHLERTIHDKGVRAFLLTNLVMKSDKQVDWRINVDSIVKNYANIGEFPKLNSSFEGSTLFIAGAVSDYIQKSDHSRIRELFPRANFYTVPGAGHWVHSEKPEEFLQVVCDFLNKPDVNL